MCWADLKGAWACEASRACVYHLLVVCVLWIRESVVSRKCPEMQERY